MRSTGQTSRLSDALVAPLPTWGHLPIGQGWLSLYPSSPGPGGVPNCAERHGSAAQARANTADCQEMELHVGAQGRLRRCRVYVNQFACWTSHMGVTCMATLPARTGAVDVWHAATRPFSGVAGQPKEQGVAVVQQRPHATVMVRW